MGQRTVVNAGGAQSRLGGATLSPAVRSAMSQASEHYVDIEALHDIVGRRLAVATRNDAAFVSAGSAAGIMIAVAAAIAGADAERASALPRASSRPSVAVWRAHSTGVLAGADAIHDNGYLNSIAAGGAVVRLIDGPDDLEATDAAVLWFPGMYGLPDEEQLLVAVIASARRLGIPVIVDAADQVPPLSRLWHYTTELGADLAIFSGGKGLKGPTSSGLVVGSAPLIEACRTNSGTEHGVGRTAKVGREELMGLLTAVEAAIAVDEELEYAAHQSVVDDWLETLSALGARTELVTTTTGHCGQHIPRLIVRLRSGERQCRDDLIAQLWELDPRVAVLPELDAAIAMSPQLLTGAEPALVGSAVRHLVGTHVRECPRCA